MANEIKTLDFDGDIDLALTDFSKSNLEKVCNISYPTFYKFWQTKPTFSKEDVVVCSESINEYAQSLGFYRAETSYEIKDDKAVITLKKNEQIKISTIQIENEYKDIIGLKTGDFFKASNFTNSKKTIKKYLSQKSFAKAQLDAKAYVDMEDYKVDIIYKVTKNAPQHFGKVTIENDAKVDENYLKEKVEFKEGELYNSLLIDKTYENLYNFGIYKYISVEQNLDTTNDIIPVDIKLLVGDYREITYGIGYDTDTKARFKAQYKNDNFWGNFKKLTIGTKINEDGYEFYNNINNPYFYFDGVSFDNDISYENMDYTSYEQEKIEEKISLSKDFFGLSHSVGFLAQLSNINSLLEEYQSGNYFLNSLFYEVSLDKRDDVLNPKNGYYLSFYIENGSKTLASEEDYIKTLTQIRYIKTFDKLTSSIKTKIGTLDKDLPIFKHFFAGGDYSNRGYSYEKLGLLDSDDNPYGGLSMIDSSLEFEYNVYKDVGIATFFDSTMLSLKPKTFNDDFYNSYGFGLRYYTPIGPLRADIGFPLDDSGFVFHIGIGQVF
ncbi:autotransporter assembly complex protein TamA [Arcobacter sp.]|uniref:autotransporter assembly complex protein TamA n=1 Tax=Arcobacter sp. TaxID=1872629 RepID=UPI003D06F023